MTVDCRRLTAELEQGVEVGEISFASQFAADYNELGYGTYG